MNVLCSFIKLWLSSFINEKIVVPNLTEEYVHHLELLIIIIWMAVIDFHAFRCSFERVLYNSANRIMIWSGLCTQSDDIMISKWWISFVRWSIQMKSNFLIKSELWMYYVLSFMNVLCTFIKEEHSTFIFYECA